MNEDVGLPSDEVARRRAKRDRDNGSRLWSPASNPALRTFGPRPARYARRLIYPYHPSLVNRIPFTPEPDSGLPSGRAARRRAQRDWIARSGPWLSVVNPGPRTFGPRPARCARRLIHFPSPVKQTLPSL